METFTCFFRVKMVGDVEKNGRGNFSVFIVVFTERD